MAHSRRINVVLYLFIYFVGSNHTLKEEKDTIREKKIKLVTKNTVGKIAEEKKDKEDRISESWSKIKNMNALLNVLKVKSKTKARLFLMNVKKVF